jgi:hypothetical protein
MNCIRHGYVIIYKIIIAMELTLKTEFNLNYV